MKEFLYKFIELDNTIVDEIINYSNNVLPKTQPRLNSFNNIEVFYENCPRTKEWVYSNNTKLLFCHRLVWSYDNLQKPHTDFNHDPESVEKFYFNVVPNHQTKNVIALNIVTSNSDNSWISYYRRRNNKHDKKTLNVLNGISGLYSENNYITYYDLEDLEEIDRIKTDRPVLLNTTVPHWIINEQSTPRVTISLRFDPDPWHLISD